MPRHTKTGEWFIFDPVDRLSQMLRDSSYGKPEPEKLLPSLTIPDEQDASDDLDAALAWALAENARRKGRGLA